MAKEQRAWTKQEIEKLKELFLEGADDRQIAKILKRSWVSIQRKRDRISCLNEGKADWTKADIERLKSLWEQGEDKESIAQALGRTVVAVEHKKSRLGLQDANRRMMRTDLGDTTGEVSFIAQGIKTEDELIKAANIDLKKWKVVRCIINKWEVVMREPATTLGGSGKDAHIARNEKSGSEWTLWTRGSKKPLHEQMFQVKLSLERITPPENAVLGLLRKLESKAQPFKPVKRLKRIRKDGKRSLETSILDPHLGLACRYPQADGPWSLDEAEAMMVEATEDLIEKTKPFGPFAEVFTAVGNDWTHCDNVFHTTTAGTGQPEALDWHQVYCRAVEVAIRMIERYRQVADMVHVYQVPGNHDRQTAYTIGRVLHAWYRNCKDVKVYADASPYKFHKCGCNLIGFEHGHSVKSIRLAALMANECPEWWSETKNGYREWHCGDQHRKGSSTPVVFEEQGVAVEYCPGLVPANSWHRIKAFSHQQRGAVAWVWDWNTGPVGRFCFNVSKFNHKAMGKR